MRLAEDDEMIHALAPNRSDQPFGKAILPRRGRCDRLVPNAHCSQSACDDGAIDLIPIADEVARRLIPRESELMVVLSPDQVDFQKGCEANGGRYHVVRSIDDVQKLGL